MSSSSAASVGVHAVRKEFPGHIALHRVDVEIESGSFTTLLGPSGCGKTTLLRILAGFESATQGTVTFDGRDVARLAPWKRNIGFVFQNYALWPHLSIEENVAYGLKLRKMSKSDIKSRVTETLSLVGLDGRASAFPGQLSGGQQQRVAIARALALQPSVLLLDEPLSNLDAKMRSGMRQELLRIQREVGITAVYVTHDQEEALEMSDRVVVMNNGRIEHVGTPQEIYEHPATSFVASFVGRVTLLSGHSDGEGGFDADLTLRIPLPPCGHPVPKGPATLVLRPENLEVTNPDSAHFIGRLDHSSYHGRGYRSTLTLQDGTVCEVEHRTPAPVTSSGQVGVLVHSTAQVPTDQHASSRHHTV